LRFELTTLRLWNSHTNTILPKQFHFYFFWYDIFSDYNYKEFKSSSQTEINYSILYILTKYSFLYTWKHNYISQKQTKKIVKLIHFEEYHCETKIFVNYFTCKSDWLISKVSFTFQFWGINEKMLIASKSLSTISFGKQQSFQLKNIFLNSFRYPLTE
jgi:hypothetical protein